jgi:hypothetical protein
MQEVIRIEPRAPAAWSVLAQCYSDMKEPKKELQLRIMAAHLRHDADEWDRLARSSKRVKHRPGVMHIDWFVFTGNWDITSRHCTVIVNFTALTRPTSTRSGIEPHWRRRWEIYEQYARSPIQLTLLAQC